MSDRDTDQDTCGSSADELGVSITAVLEQPTTIAEADRDSLVAADPLMLAVGSQSASSSYACEPLVRDLLERIQHLEKALDQTIASSQELRLQLKDQDLLENQLALTEEYSHLQQWEIDRLKKMLLDKSATDPPTEELQAELSAAWTRIASLEVQLDEAQQQITRLCSNLSDRQVHLVRAEAQVEHLRTILQEQAPQFLHRRTPLAVTTSSPKYLANDADELIWQRRRIHELEQQVSEMQEQILAQERQAGEYEAAIQHWKDCYLASQRQNQDLMELIERLMPEPPTELATILAKFRVGTLADNRLLVDASSAKSSLASKGQKVDLPAFLTRYRKQS